MMYDDVFVCEFQPDTLGSLPSLEELWLDCNEISELPPVRKPLCWPLWLENLSPHLQPD